MGYVPILSISICARESEPFREVDRNPARMEDFVNSQPQHLAGIYLYFYLGRMSQGDSIGDTLSAVSLLHFS